MTQLNLPFPGASPEATKAAAEAIQRHLGNFSELKGDPVYHCLTNEWICLVAVTPSGPLVRMSFGLSRVK